jgi:hypothetical protein
MKKLACVALAGLALSPCPAWAQDSAAAMISPTKPAQLQAVLLEEGYRAKLGVDDVGDPMITSATAGYDFDIMFYDCTDNADCKSIQFYIGLSDPDNGTPEELNGWNSENRYARAYLDEEGDAILRMDVAMPSEGVSKEVFLENLSLWESLMSGFVEYVWD